MKNSILRGQLFSIIVVLLSFCWNIIASAQTATASKSNFRPPAIPLITCDPYFSIWSTTDKLYDEWTKHWTGANHALACMVRIDGKPYRIMGRSPSDVPAMAQTDVQVYPTRTVYQFEADGVCRFAEFRFQVTQMRARAGVQEELQQ